MWLAEALFLPDVHSTFQNFASGVTAVGPSSRHSPGEGRALRVLKPVDDGNENARIIPSRRSRPEDVNVQIEEIVNLGGSSLPHPAGALGGSNRRFRDRLDPVEDIHYGQREQIAKPLSRPFCVFSVECLWLARRASPGESRAGIVVAGLSSEKVILRNENFNSTGSSC